MIKREFLLSVLIMLLSSFQIVFALINIDKNFAILINSITLLVISVLNSISRYD